MYQNLGSVFNVFHFTYARLTEVPGKNYHVPCINHWCLEHVFEHWIYLPSGNKGIKWSYLLNVPYVYYPIYAGVRFIKDGLKIKVTQVRNVVLNSINVNSSLLWVVTGTVAFIKKKIITSFYKKSEVCSTTCHCTFSLANPCSQIVAYHQCFTSLIYECIYTYILHISNICIRSQHLNTV